MVCSSAYAGTASSCGTAACSAGASSRVRAAMASQQRARSVMRGSLVEGARVLVLQPVAVLHGGAPRHAVAVEEALLRQVVLLVVVLALAPRGVLLHLQAAGQQRHGAEQGDANAGHDGSFPGSFWKSLGTWLTRGASPLGSMRPCWPAS